jgi:hypothetical protein
MKKTIFTVASVVSFLIAPAPAFALFNVNQGGTGQAFFTAGSLLYGNGANPIATTTPGTLGYVLQFNGTFPTWVSTSSLGLVAGSNGEIQFNNNGVFGASNKLTWDGSTLSIGGGPFGPSTFGDGPLSTIGYSLLLKGNTLSLVAEDTYGLDRPAGSATGSAPRE